MKWLRLKNIRSFQRRNVSLVIHFSKGDLKILIKILVHLLLFSSGVFWGQWNIRGICFEVHSYVAFGSSCLSSVLPGACSAFYYLPILNMHITL